MFGGTPSNLAISVMQNRAVEVIAGVNLPMLVKLGRVRGEMTIRDAVNLAQEAGRKYITIANSILGAG
jgi:PTS system mannose-specific IIA component